MTEIRLGAKTFVVTDDGQWIKTWDEREPVQKMTTEEIDQVGGGCPSIYNE